MKQHILSISNMVIMMMTMMMMKRRRRSTVQHILQVPKAFAFSHQRVPTTRSTISNNGVTAICSSNTIGKNTLHASNTSTQFDNQDTHDHDNHNDNENSIGNDNEDIYVPRKFQPFPFHYHQELILQVESLTNRGIGICRTNIDANSFLPSPSHHHHDQPKTTEDTNINKINVENDKKGWVVFVPNVIPGETIKCSIYRNHKSYSEADLISIIQPSSHRISNPPCPYFETCGGCQYQHMDIGIQREWKANQVQDLLERIGEFDKGTFPQTKDTVGTEHIYHYRSKITPHYDRPHTANTINTTTTTTNNNNNNIKSLEIKAIGFKQKTNRNIVDIPYCYIATDAINQKLTLVRNELFQSAKDGTLKRPKKGATLLLRDAHEYIPDEKDDKNQNQNDDGNHNDNNNIAIVETDPNVYVQTNVHGLTFRFLAGNFFQNNPYMLPVMVNHVIDAAVKNNSNGDKMTHLIDCYCGSGLFCLSCAKDFDVCVGIEVNEKAVEEATVNADINKITNCKFVSASAEAIFQSEDMINIQTKTAMTTTTTPPPSIKVQDFPRSTTVVVIDPPRKGCSTEFLDQLHQFSPERIVYMSCDPATQARDAKSIVRFGYDMMSIQPFDLFPQTRHIENLIVFEKRTKLEVL